MTVAAAIFRPPRTPLGYRNAREPTSPLARYSGPLPPRLPSLMAWKSVCKLASLEVSASLPALYNTETPSPTPRRQNSKRKLEEAELGTDGDTGDASLQCVLQAGRDCKRARAGRRMSARTRRRRSD